MSETAFPIQSLLPQVRASLQDHPRLVLEAPPGAGKTTQVPLALLDAEWLGGRKIVMLEPRRLAARTVAARIVAAGHIRCGERVLRSSHLLARGDVITVDLPEHEEPRRIVPNPIALDVINAYLKPAPAT